MNENFWNDLPALRSMSSWLQWISISLVFLSGLLQVSKYLVDKREKALSSVIQAELLNPVAQPIRAATITVEVVTASDDNINTTFMDSGGYAAFARGAEAMLTVGATQARAFQTGQGEVIWRGVFTMEATDPSVGKPVRFLRDAEYLQLGFVQMPAMSQIKRGQAVVTVNNAVRIEIPVPAQKIDQGRIFVRDLTSAFEALR